MASELQTDTMTAQDAAETRAALSTHRWNIERDGNDLLICDGEHDKHEPCEYVRYTPAVATGGY